MSMKDFLDRHPLPIITGVILGVSASTAGVMTYLTDKAFEVERRETIIAHKIEISALETRLVSIERKLGDGQSFFDISTLMLPAERIRTLGSDYRTMAEGQFFLLEPLPSNLKYELTSELDLLKSILVSEDANSALPFQLVAAIAQKNLHLWRSSELLTITSKTSEDDDLSTSMTFFPYVSVQVIKIKDLKAMAATMVDSMDTDSELQKISERISSLSKELDQITNDDRDKVGLVEGSANSIDETHLALPRTEGEVKVEIEGQLSDLFQGDVAGIMLGGLVMQTLVLSQLFPDANSSLRTVQKRGNVMYVQTTATFNNVTIADTTATTAYLDQEFFVITNAESVLIVRTHVPTIDGRSEAFTWVSQWLSGFRAPIKST